MREQWVSFCCIVQREKVKPSGERERDGPRKGRVVVVVVVVVVGVTTGRAPLSGTFLEGRMS